MKVHPPTVMWSMLTIVDGNQANSKKLGCPTLKSGIKETVPQKSGIVTILTFARQQQPRSMELLIYSDSWQNSTKFDKNTNWQIILHCVCL